MNPSEALEALKQGHRVQTKTSKEQHPEIYFQMFQGDRIFRMKTVSSCAAEPLREFRLDIWLYFAKFDEWVMYEG